MDTRQKRPADQLDFDISFAAWLAGGDTVTSAEAVSSDPEVLVVEAIQITTTVVKVWLSGGVLGASYTITITASTSAGRVKEKVFRVQVRDN